MNIKAINLSAIAAMVVTLTALPACAKQEDKKVEINAKEVAAALAPIELNGVFYPALAPLGDVPTPADNPTTPEKVAVLGEDHIRPWPATIRVQQLDASAAAA